MAKELKIKFPKQLGACADRLFELKNLRLEKQKEADELKRQESAYRDHIINTLPKSEASGISGRLCRVSVVNKPVPQVVDWDAFYKHVKKTGHFDLMQRRLSDGAIKERWENGKEVPGVDHHTVTTVSINKL